MIEHHERTDGVDAIRVLCDDCMTRLGATIVYRLTHDITPEEEKKAEKSAADHQKEFPHHNIRVLRFRT